MTNFVEELARKRKLDKAEEEAAYKVKKEKQITDHQTKLKEKFTTSIVYKTFPIGTSWEYSFISPMGDLIVKDLSSGIEFYVTSFYVYDYYKVAGQPRKNPYNNMSNKKDLENYCLKYIEQIKKKEV